MAEAASDGGRVGGEAPAAGDGGEGGGRAPAAGDGGEGTVVEPCGEGATVEPCGEGVAEEPGCTAFDAVADGGVFGTPGASAHGEGLCLCAWTGLVPLRMVRA